MNRHAVRLALTTAVAAAGVPDACRAQDVMPVVTVTAQSRSQDIQNVPIAVQTLAGSALRDVGVVNLAGMDAFVPGLSVEPLQSTRPIIFLRGVGTEDYGIGTDSPVGIFTDSVYAGKTGGSLLNFNDVKRIEVLKGPQGTLFGRNAAAGVISIVTNDPVERTEAGGLVRVGTRGAVHTELLYNTPLAEGLALRISAVDQRDNGWVRNTFNGQRMGDDGERGLRATVRWRRDDTDAILGWEHGVMRVSGPPVFSLTGGKIDFGGPATWVDPRRQPLANDAEPDAQARTFDGLTLRVTTPLRHATLSSITAYRHFNTQNWQDNDGSVNPAAYIGIGNVESNSTWQQEFKLSGQNGALDWVGGVSAYRERATQAQHVDLTTLSLDTLIRHAAGSAPYATLTGLAQGIGRATGNAALQGLSLAGLPWRESIHDKGEYRAYAVYGDLLWHVSPVTNLTVGGRFTHDDKRFSWYNPPRIASELDARLAVMQQAQLFPTAVALKLLTPQQAASLQAVVARNVEFNNTVSSTSPFPASRSWNNFSPRIVLDRHLTRDHMVYGSWSKGYLAGGFDALGVNGYYDEELVTNTEIGIKGRVRALGLSYEASIFHYDYTNLQSLTLVAANAGAGVPSYQVVNSDQRATGAELSAQWTLNRIWRLNGALAYLDQTYAHYVSPSGVRLDGQPPGAPRLSASAGATARWPLWNGTADFNVMLGYIGERRCNADTRAQGTCNPDGSVDTGAAREKVDVRLGWTAPSGNWGVGAVVTNLTNRQTIAISTLGAVVGSPYSYVSKPRAIALELRGRL
ncbi:TonB-dependent receptor [Massilia orientalis]|uniref:TonB-dependent receptor n=1 Tax=Massilia orientalis TaxID=3050128 RepID=A0ACC7MEB2_9BURK|nr:TonB-dependent receptor [Massilia sp. YIM B02787]